MEIYGQIFFGVSGIATLILSVVLFNMHAGYRIGKSAQTRGYLKEAKYQKDVYRGGKVPKHYKHMTDCVYTYRVNDVPYEVKLSIPQKPHQAPKTVMVTYQIKHPKRSCIGNDITYLVGGFVALFYCLIMITGFVLCFFDI